VTDIVARSWKDESAYEGVEVATIDPSQPLPIYVQLKTLLLEEIVGGRYAPGAQLPTEHELCASYGISRTPVHRALAELAEEGAILRHRRRGSFVNPHWLQRQQSQQNKPELRVVVPEGPWEQLMRDVCPDDLALSVASVQLDDLHQVLTHAVAEGRAPDLAVLDSVWVPEFAASGFLHQLAELDASWLADEYLVDALAPFVRANRYQGQVVAVQAEADVAGLWFRRDALSAAGIDPPTTWRQLSAACRLLHKRGVEHPLAMPAGSRGGEATTYCLLGLLSANGGSVIEDGLVTVDAPATVETLTFLRSLVSAGALPVDAVSYERDRAPRLLARGQAVLAIGGSYELQTLADENATSMQDAWAQYGFIAPPRGPRAGATTLGGGMVHAVFRQASNPHLAMRLIQRLSSPEALARMSLRTGQLASRRSAATLASESSEFLASTGALLEKAVLRPATRTYPRVSSQLQGMLEAVLVRRATPAAAATRAAELVAAITGLPLAERSSAH
jgi:multiple sugar transport system substrate-binding protein